MATFCDVTSVAAMLPDTELNTATSSLIGECITNAEDEIRRALAVRYDISSDYFQTSTATPPGLRKICKWLSIGYTYEALSRGGKNAFDRADRYIKKAMDEIKSIQEYKSSLVDTAGSVIPGGTNNLPMFSNTEDYHDTFDEGREIRWRIDRDKLQDIRDEKD